MTDSIIVKAVDNLVEEIKKSDIYVEYDFQRDKLKKQPELFDRVQEYRRRNYELQNNSQGEDLFEKMDAFEKEYEEFLEIPLVDDFLNAELAFCRMMQEVNMRITTELDFE
ncbi:MAG: YlbF family regulator [Lachnospiraceae bacterium]|nr:YlbF family regulator [Lachnospiraceae bacterium]